MKSTYLFALCLLLCQCAREPKITYDIPDNYPDARRKQIIDIFEKGKVLYKANCSGCHGIFTKGKDSIPNFSAIQIDNYGARFMNGDPENHAVARKMSEEQLKQVLAFLRFRKMNGSDTVRPAKKKPLNFR